ncbi:hypothetical protein ABPG74_018535 [Tetrahymena malaccensis]
MSQSKQYVNNQIKSVNKVQTPHLIPDLSNIIKIVCGANHSYAIDNSYEVYAWGCNLGRKLGLSDEYYSQLFQTDIPEQIKTPVKVTELSNKKINNISTGTNHSFAWSKESNQVYCWGIGEYGKLGNKDSKDIQYPEIFNGLKQPEGIQWEISDISCGENHTVAVIKQIHANNPTNYNKLYVWGSSSDWQLGVDTGKSDYVNHPLEMSPDYWEGNLESVKACSDFTIAIDKQGKIFSWGKGGFNRLGYKAEIVNQKFPQQIDSLSKHQIVQFSLGSFHSAAITNNGRLFTWGRDSNGQLGYGQEKADVFPKEVQALSNTYIASVACGEGHTLALSKNNELFSWGLNSSGQLGRVSDSLKSSDPKKIVFFEDKSIKQIACGSKHSLVLLQDGTVYSWGSNQYGQLGFDQDNNTQNTIASTQNMELISQNSSQIFNQQLNQNNTTSQFQQQQFNQNNMDFQAANQFNGNELAQLNNVHSGLQLGNVQTINNNQSQTFMSPNSFVSGRNQIGQKPYQNINPSYFQNQQQFQQPQLYLPSMINRGTPTNPIQSHDSSNSFNSSTPVVQKNGKSPSSESSKDYLNKLSPQLIVNRQVSRVNNNSASLYNNQEPNISNYNNYHGNNSQDIQQDERDKQIQLLLQENQFLRARVKYLEQNQDLESESQEKVYNLTSMYLDYIMENAVIQQQNTLNNFYQQKYDQYQIEQDVNYKNHQVDRSLEDFRKRIDLVKNPNITSVCFCQQIMKKLSRFIKQVFNNLDSYQQQQHQQQPGFVQNMSNSQHHQYPYFNNNNMMKQQYIQQNNQYQQQQQYLMHNQLAQSSVSANLSLQQQQQPPSNIIGQLQINQQQIHNNIQQGQAAINSATPPLQSVQGEMLNPATLHLLSSQNQQM